MNDDGNNNNNNNNVNTMTHVKAEVVVIGAGPAGLSFLHSTPTESVLVVEEGAPLRERDHDATEGPDVCTGVGGAGLFSDGKWSFFPAGTAVWRLSPTSILADAYQDLADLLVSAAPHIESSIPPFPTSLTSSSPSDCTPDRTPDCTPDRTPDPVDDGSSKEWTSKSYPSVYLDLDERYALVDNMLASTTVHPSLPFLSTDHAETASTPATATASATATAPPTTTIDAPTLWCRSRVTSLTITRDADNNPTGVDLILRPSPSASASSPPLQTIKVHAQKVVLAGGRFGSLGLPDSLLDPADVGMTFRRLEVGVRIEDESSSAFFYDHPQIDVKLLRRPRPDVQYRTFCACREGEIVSASCASLHVLSGRSDIPPTGRSNIGFNTRVLCPDKCAAMLPGLLSSFSDPDSRFRVSLGSVLDSPDSPASRQMSDVYGSDLFALVREGLLSLADAYPILAQSSTVSLSGPTLEGIGAYVTSDPTDLGVLSPDGHSLPLYVCGDMSGTYRGIVASMLSAIHLARLMRPSQ